MSGQKGQPSRMRNPSAGEQESEGREARQQHRTPELACKGSPILGSPPLPLPPSRLENAMTTGTA
jgi:hypothetical protein